LFFGTYNACWQFNARDFGSDTHLLLVVVTTDTYCPGVVDLELQKLETLRSLVGFSPEIERSCWRRRTRTRTRRAGGRSIASMEGQQMERGRRSSS
jgi:hypothetical protein